MIQSAQWLRRTYYRLLARLLVVASKTPLFTAYQPIPQIGLNIAPHRQKGVLARWEAMRNELPASPCSFLDIGCNIGFYVTSAAEQGHFAMGLDTREYAMAHGVIREALDLRNATVVPMMLGPANASSLPQFDVVIMLQLFHHLCAAYGKEEACNILDTIWQKTRHKLLLEIEPSRRAKEPFRSKMPDTGEDSAGWIRDFFSERGCKEIREIYRDEGHHRSVMIMVKEPAGPDGSTR